MKVALVYDRINKWGGAESVLLALHEIFPDAPLYTSVYDKKPTPWANSFNVRTSFLQKTPLPKNKHEYYPFLMGLAFESFNFDEYDVVISVTHEFAKAIITKPSTLHICYCLTPTSYLWSGYEQYFAGRSEFFKTISSPIIKYLRSYDKIICHRPDKYIAISQTVQERIKKYYGLSSEVIYPPVNMPNIRHTGYVIQDTGYYLIVARLVPNKRLDLAIKAFNKLGLPLKIVGSGRQEKVLKSMANSNIEFLGSLTSQELDNYYRNSHALVVPAVEDFGIVSVEAQSYGKPVIAYGFGGSAETVVENKTGWFFKGQNEKSLVDIINRTKSIKINPRDCFKSAERFSKQRFEKEFLQMVEHSLNEKK